MAAAIGAISAQQPPEMVKQLTAIAAASNLLTTVVGFYFTLFLSLPLCVWLYDRLEPVLGRFSKRPQADTAALSGMTGVAAPEMRFVDTLVAGVVMAGGVMIGNLLSFKVPMLDSRSPPSSTSSPSPRRCWHWPASRSPRTCRCSASSAGASWWSR
jgi:hypothetical protein